MKSKGISLVEKEESELQPGEYRKAVDEPRDANSGESPVWTVTWYPREE